MLGHAVTNPAQPVAVRFECGEVPQRLYVYLLLIGLVEQWLYSLLEAPFYDFAPAVYNADKTYVAVKLDNLIAKVSLNES